jgi:hypothetical protein
MRFKRSKPAPESFDDAFVRAVMEQIKDMIGPDADEQRIRELTATATVRCAWSIEQRRPPLTCLSVSEIRRMHAIFCRPAHTPEHHLHWSRWRRRHQAAARKYRHQR